jgi:hypothetical protein
VAAALAATLGLSGCAFLEGLDTSAPTAVEVPPEAPHVVTVLPPTPPRPTHKPNPPPSAASAGEQAPAAVAAPDETVDPERLIGLGECDAL